MGTLHRLGANAPSTWQHHYDLRLKLRYERLNDRYRFSYKYSIETTNVGGGIIETVARADWRPLMRKGAFRDDIFLNIRISGDTWVEVETSGRNLSWSTTPGKDAIMTKEDRASLYSELQYWNDVNNAWQAEADANSKRRIRFKAKHHDDRNDNKHAFSFNVYLRKLDNSLDDYEIDPDIQNPKV